MIHRSPSRRHRNYQNSRSRTSDLANTVQVHRIGAHLHGWPPFGQVHLKRRNRRFVINDISLSL